MLFLLHLGLEGVTEVGTDPKERFVSFKKTTSNESSVCAPSGYSTRMQLPPSDFFGVLNCTMNKINSDGGDETHILYRCCPNNAFFKLIVDNGLEDLWRRENPDSSEFICCDRYFAKDKYRPSMLIFSKGPIKADVVRGM